MRYQLDKIEDKKNVVVKLPASKSISNRVLIINAMCKNPASIENIAKCDDTDVMVKALASDKTYIDIMAAGTAMRFLTAYLSITDGEHIITGTKRMQERPISILVDALKQLGAEISYLKNEGFPPLKINGTKLGNSAITLKSDISSQYISALLMIAPKLEKGLTITLDGEIISYPYIHLTLKIMSEFGVDSEWLTPNVIQIKPQDYKAKAFCVENDWSAASYWYEIAALNPNQEIRLKGLFKESYQGDQAGVHLFEKLGISSVFDTEGVLLKRNNNSPQYIKENLIDIPDLAQTFVVTCALLNIPFEFSGLQSLKIKETDRISALIKELKKLGYLVSKEKDSILKWNGERCEADASPIIETYDDHRMAMAFAPASLHFKNLRINHPEVVSKSYPNFWNDLRNAGFLFDVCNS